MANDLCYVFEGVVRDISSDESRESVTYPLLPLCYRDFREGEKTWIRFIFARRLWRVELELSAGADSAKEGDLLFSPGLPMPFRENEKGKSLTRRHAL